jgi:hypothetical protein
MKKREIKACVLNGICIYFMHQRIDSFESEEMGGRRCSAETLKPRCHLYDEREGKMKKFLFASIFSVALMIPFAAAAGVWTGWGQITELTEYGLGLRVTGLDLSANPAGCSHTETAFVDINLDNVQIDRLNSLLLAAFLSGREVSVKMDSSLCIENRPAIYAVSVR